MTERDGKVAIVGMGQLGTELSRGYEALGARVLPLRRGDDPRRLAETHPDVDRVVVAVGEADLHPCLEGLPTVLRERSLLLQNELLPRDWERHGIEDPTVAVIWFEKKSDKPRREILKTPIAGPGAETAAAALTAIGIGAETVPRRDLVFELVAKNLYILTSNLAGLEVGGTVGDLVERHRELMDAVVHDVLAVQEALVGESLPRGALIEKLEAAIAADPEHGCRGRSAPARLARALEHARGKGLRVPALEALARHLPS